MQNLDIYNNMQCVVDWLEFTFHPCYTYEDVVAMLSLNGVMKSMGHGGFGYKEMYQHNVHDISLFAEGNEDMGIHCRVKGSAVRDFLEIYLSSKKCDTPFGVAYDIDFNYSADNILAYFVKEINRYGHFTRIDLAVDDFNPYFTVKDVYGYFETACVVTKFRSYRYVEEKNILGEFRGTTLYCGSRQSDVMLRIYDKVILSILVYTFFSRMFDPMLILAVKHSTAVV